MKHTINSSLVRNILIASIMALSVFCCASLFTTVTADAATTLPKPSATCRVNSSDGVNMRKYATTSSKSVKTLNDNTKVTVIKVVFTSKTKSSAKNRWYYVKVNGVKGYIRGDLVDSFSYSSVKAKITGKQIYRVGAGTSMTAKGHYSKGDIVYLKLEAKAKGSTKVWYKVKKNGKYYYIACTNVKILATTNSGGTSGGNSGGSGGTSQPAKPEPAPEPTKPSTPASSVAVSDTKAMNRINQLYNALNKKYFTVNGKPSSGSGATECNVARVVKENSDVVALIKQYKGGALEDTWRMPGHYSSNYKDRTAACTYYSLGYSCCGFCNFAEWYISADRYDEDVTCKPSPVAKNIKYDYATVKKAVDAGNLKVGDACRTNGNGSYGTHSFIFIELQSNGCLVLDANCQLEKGDKAGECRIYKHVIPWGDYVMTVSRSNKRK